MILVDILSFVCPRGERHQTVPLAASLLAFVTHHDICYSLEKSPKQELLLYSPDFPNLVINSLLLFLNCLSGTLMILKSACSYNASYIDRLISVFMRSLQKMVREHLSPQQANPGVTETSTGTYKDRSTKIVCWLKSVGILPLKIPVQNISDLAFFCKTVLTFFLLFFFYFKHQLG